MYAHVSASTSGSTLPSYFEAEVEPEVELMAYHLFLTRHFSTENQWLSTVYAHTFQQTIHPPSIRKHKKARRSLGTLPC